MQAGAKAFQLPQQDEVPRDRVTPAMRAGLVALEREFSDLLSRSCENRSSQDVDQRIDVARRLLEYPEAC
jgi:hypothetical protein